MENKNYQKIHSYIRLKSMTDFVLENSKEPYVEGTKYKDIVSYAHFLKKPLKLGYFIPCDENDKPLEEPINFKIWEKLHFNNGKSEKGTIGFKEHEKYQEAKQRVLFEYQWEFQSWDSSDMENSRIEDLLSDELTYILTETAIKEIGIL